MEEQNDFHFDPEKNYDEATLAQQREIEKEVSDQQPLISDKINFDEIRKEYSKEDEVYLHKLESLKKKYKCVRRTRGDGNCFFRAFGYAFFESLLENLKDFNRFQDIANKSKDELINLGFPQFTIEDFHETFMGVVNKLNGQCTLTELLESFNDQGLSDYLVVYLRLIVSGFLQKEEEFYSNFIEGERTVKEFCNQEVEPMGKESDHIHIIALTSCLGVPVRVVYMDRGEGENCTEHNFPEGSEPVVTMLYRPGHYDVLYK